LSKMSDFKFMFCGSFKRKLYSDGTCLVPASKSAGSIIADNDVELLKNMCINKSYIPSAESKYSILDVLAKDYEYSSGFNEYRVGNSIDLDLKTDIKIRLPEDYIKHVGLEDSVQFVGCGEWFEIWNPQDWKEYSERIDFESLFKYIEFF